MRNVFWAAAMFSALFVSGCNLWRKDSPAPNPAPTMTASANAAPRQNLIITPDDTLNGKVVRAESNLQFVVVNFPLGQMPMIGQRLMVYRRGLKAGELKVTGPQQDDNIVADIAVGDAIVGDEVRDK